MLWSGDLFQERWEGRRFTDDQDFVGAGISRALPVCELRCVPVAKAENLETGIVRLHMSADNDGHAVEHRQEAATADEEQNEPDKSREGWEGGKGREGWGWGVVCRHLFRIGSSGQALKVGVG